MYGQVNEVKCNKILHCQTLTRTLSQH